MKYLTSFVAVALAACAVTDARGLNYPSEALLDIKTTSGHLSGFINKTARNVRQFLGVAYAEPPLESLRFQPPKRKHSSEHVSAENYAPSCKQIISKSPTVYTEHMTQFLTNGGDSEDCLYLNVYAPLKPTAKKLPVFIYIPGGGFTGGGADSLYKIPDKWIQKTQSHIVVTMNYRVNLFGFPNAEAAQQNVGLLDQRMVVEWTRDNIAAFGGDPHKMTLWGQSAGAGSVGMYGYAYPKDLIVKGLISDSGAPAMLARAYAELPLLFGTHYEYRGNSTEYEWEVAEGMQSLWLSFANNPKKNPQAGNVTWPLYKPNENNMAVFAEAGTKWFQLGKGSLTETQCN
ncbi:unnamed protein product [Clonostachys rosea f. rosea IK726]|uniref:Carboxylic ester hydrolase n=2 Tax=Bionectria ochroleuca TaxID=29856 RepID=A0A0B7K2E2_BIOOC|nr:unnamed protein product [Clonostachys rosea f. rosea IK726]